eukprot:TRINITY_DN480_c0_g1_i1.p2 TRINITY_DN480_c0_g1~~TRINITY_DN480_c0_g1_i1.p2  ORF type:complete len:193 (-),score=72.41 TRINITY_DN480_c0_g1_i1:73-651(-)
MKAAAVCVLGLLSGAAEGTLLRSSGRLAQEPDTSCGKGFENLVPGSQKYFATAQEKLWTHPGRTGQAGTFETELQCWYANMLTQKCGGLVAKPERTEELSAKCTDVTVDWLQVWKLFGPEEVEFWKKSYPANPIDAEEAANEVNPKGIHYKQALKTTLELNKKEVLCMTLFVIDDECGAHSYIRMADTHATK